MSDVTKLLDELIAGRKTVEEVAEDFRNRDWPMPTRQRSKSLDDVETRALDDPEVPPEGSFFEVLAYFDQKRLDADLYGTLATAAVEAMNGKKVRPGTPAVAGASADDEENL